jgi:rubrerythrin
MRKDIPAINQICDDLKAGNISINQALYWLQMHAQAAKRPEKTIAQEKVFKCPLCDAICENLGKNHYRCPNNCNASL